jgi:hypothetical protein
MDYRRRQGFPDDSGSGDGEGNENDIVSHQQRRPLRAGEASAALDNFAQTAVTAFVQKVWASPKAKAGLLLWIIGFSFMVFAPALTKLTPEMKAKYEDMVQEASNTFGMGDAKAEVRQAQAEVYDAQVWFWRFRPEYREVVEKKQAILAVKQSKLDELQAVRDEKMRKANGYVGIWSEYGMQDMREKFWSAFESGKVFAGRQTFWQILFSSREENFLSTLLSWLITALINFTLGLLGALFYFVFSLGSLILYYDAGSLSGLAFYAIALLGGASLVATYLFALYGMAAGAVYAVGKFALTSAIKDQERQRARIQYQNRQHHQHQQ